jgi:hypothetical protein
VTIKKVPPDAQDVEEVAVTVTMNWKDNLISRSYTISENIFNYAQ